MLQKQKLSNKSKNKRGYQKVIWTKSDDYSNDSLSGVQKLPILPRYEKNSDKPVPLKEFDKFRNFEMGNLISAPFKGGICFRYAFLVLMGDGISHSIAKCTKSIEKTFSIHVDRYDVDKSLKMQTGDYTLKQVQALCSYVQLQCVLVENTDQLALATSRGIYLLRSGTQTFHVCYIAPRTDQEELDMIQQLPEGKKDSVVKGLNQKDQRDSQIPIQRSYVQNKKDSVDEGQALFQNPDALQRSFKKEDDVVILQKQNEQQSVSSQRSHAQGHNISNNIIQKTKSPQLFGRYATKRVPKSNGDTVDHVTLPFNHAFGKDGTEMIKSFLRSKKHSLHSDQFHARRQNLIPHPVMRSINNYFNYKGVSKMKGCVVDIGSKYAIMSSYTDSLIAYRPILQSYDESYVEMHPLKEEVDNVNFSTNTLVKHTVVSEKLAKTVYPSVVTINANDCIYYPGVAEYIVKMISSGKAGYAMVNFIAMPSYDGDFAAVDNEAVASVRDGVVSFQAAGNEYTYRHNVFQWDNTTPQVRACGNTVWDEVDRLQVSDKLALVSVRVSLNPERAKQTSVKLNEVVATKYQRVYRIVSRKEVDYRTQKQSFYDKALPMEMVDFAYGKVMQEERETKFKFEKLARTVRHHWKIKKYSQNEVMPEWEDVQLEDCFSAAMVRYSGYLDRMETQKETPMMKRIIDQTSEPWAWDFLASNASNISIIFIITSVALILSSIQVIYPVAFLLMWNYHETIQKVYQRCESITVSAKYPRNIIKTTLNTLFLSTMWYFYHWQGICLAMVFSLTRPKNDEGNKVVRGFKRIHVDRERFDRDVLKPGEGCVRETKTQLVYDETLYDQLLQHCTCNRGKKYVRTGLNHRTAAGTTQAYAYESCPINLVYGLRGRHNGSRLRPEMQHLRQFAAMTSTKLTKLVNQMNFEEVQSFQSYLSKFDMTKRARYQKAFDQFCYDGEVDQRLEVMTKTGEINYTNDG